MFMTVDIDLRGFEMKKFSFAIVAALAFAGLGMTGCGGGGDNKVIEVTPVQEELAAAN